MGVEAGKPTFFETPAALRVWFEANAGRESVVWVGFRKKGSGLPSITWPESVDQALCFGWIDGIRKSLGETSYVIRFTPRKRGSHWSTVNLKRVPELIAAGLMTAPGLAVYGARDPTNEAKAAYEQETPAELPADMQERFAAEPDAWAHFQAQAPSYRRLMAHWVTRAKRPETRERRFAQLLEASREGRRSGAVLG